MCEYAKTINPKIKVIGSAGSKEKLDILRNIGVDVTINYKEQDTEAILREHGPIDMSVLFLPVDKLRLSICTAIGTTSQVQLSMQHLST